MVVLVVSAIVNQRRKGQKKRKKKKEKVSLILKLSKNDLFKFRRYRIVPLKLVMNISRSICICLLIC